MLGLKVHLTKEFEIKDSGSLRYFLGIEMVRSQSGFFISQQKCTQDLLQEMSMISSKSSLTL